MYQCQFSKMMPTKMERLGGSKRQLRFLSSLSTPHAPARSHRRCQYLHTLKSSCMNETSQVNRFTVVGYNTNHRSTFLRSISSLATPPFKELVDKLKSTNQTCTIIESSCGGLISSSLMSIPGSSRVYWCVSNLMLIWIVILLRAPSYLHTELNDIHY